MHNASKNSSPDVRNCPELDDEFDLPTVPHSSVFHFRGTYFPNHAHDSKTLLPLAKLLLLHLLRGSDEWLFHDREIMNFLGVGRNKLKTLFTNLRNHGYVLIVKIQEKGTKTWLGSKRMFSPEPIFIKDGVAMGHITIQVDKKNDIKSREFNFRTFGEYMTREFNSRTVLKLNSHINKTEDPIINNKKNYNKKDFDESATMETIPPEPKQVTEITNTESIPEPESVKKQTKKSKSLSKIENSELEAQFNLFWDEYPVKKGRKEAQEAFLKATKHILPEKIIIALRAQKCESEHIGRLEQKPPFKYWVQAKKWLNKERWDDKVKSAAEIEKEFGKLDKKKSDIEELMRKNSI